MFAFPRLLDALANPLPGTPVAQEHHFFFQSHREANRERCHWLAWVFRRPVCRSFLLRHHDKLNVAASLAAFSFAHARGHMTNAGQ